MTKDGALDYIEIPATDIAATKKFYADVFGWQFTDYGPDYAAFEFGGRSGGVNRDRKPVESGGPLLVLYANDLDAMESRIKAAGAAIISRESFEGGSRFHFRDPSGNEVAVWTRV